MPFGGREHPYSGKTIVFPTMHEKEKIVGPILDAWLGTRTILATGVDTDQLGTFTGEKIREKGPFETAIQKARLALVGIQGGIAIASEGSFGPHPAVPFLNADLEILALVDDNLHIVVQEYVVSTSLTCAEVKVKNLAEAEPFLKKVGFGAQGVVVRPNSVLRPGDIRKGIQGIDALRAAIDRSVQISTDGLARIETDMRAHMNPKRQAVIQELALKFARRISQLCDECACPGWGVIDYVAGLPCELCDGPTTMILSEIERCPRCRFTKVAPRSDGKKTAEAQNCPRCNP